MIEIGIKLSPSPRATVDRFNPLNFSVALRTFERPSNFERLQRLSKLSYFLQETIEF